MQFPNKKFRNKTIETMYVPTYFTNLFKGHSSKNMSNSALKRGKLLHFPLSFPEADNYTCRLLPYSIIGKNAIISIVSVQWCSGKFSLVGTLAWHYGHISYRYRGGGGVPE